VAENLNTETAKSRLREVGQELEVASWVRERPFTTLLVAAVAGGVAARVPRNPLLTFLDVLMQVVLEDATKDHDTTPQD